MKWLSLNCHGLANPTKRLAFKRLMEAKWVDVLFLQETLGLIDMVIPMLESLVQGWKFHALDV